MPNEKKNADCVELIFPVKIGNSADGIAIESIAVLTIRKYSIL